MNCEKKMTTQQEIYYIFHILKNYYKLIGIDLSRHANTKIPQKINFTEKLEIYDGVTMFFIAEK